MSALSKETSNNGGYTMKIPYFIILILFTCFIFSCESLAGNGNLFIDAPDIVQSPGKRDPTVIRERYVRISFNSVVAKEYPEGAESIVLNLFDDLTIIARKDRIESRKKNRYTWFGHVEGVKHSQVILVVENGIMAGNITMNGNMYQIRDLGNGIHSVREIDQNRFPPEDCPNSESEPDKTSDVLSDIAENPDIAGSIPNNLADDGSIIDVLVVYTPMVANASGNINTEIQLAIDETNTSYANSSINQRLNLVHTAQVDYTEPVGSCSIYTYRNQLQNPTDGIIDNVHDLRAQYGADVVSFWVENGCGYCGVAYDIMDPVSITFESDAFSVVARSCATGYYSFGHELGHLMSARHDWYVDSTDNSPFTYNHGFVDPGDQWRTVMAYGNDCNWCTRIPYWSNPDVTYNGQAMGIPEGQYHAADNRKTLNNTAYTVSNFRPSGFCSVPSTYYWDADGDGYGNPASTIQACSPQSGHVSNNTDCNDNNASIHPGSAEVCDGVDNNCNGQVDEGVKITYYRDADGDGYGNLNINTQACSPPSGYVLNNTDCDDNDPKQHPDAFELCNSEDDNCDGRVDEARMCGNCSNKPVRVVDGNGSNAGDYATLPEAYDAAQNGYTIKVQALDFYENFSAYSTKTVTLSGGYNCDYTSGPLKTTLKTVNGNVYISDGTVIMGDVRIKDAPDTDSDGMADEWKAAFNVNDPNLDNDSDGLSNYEEFLYGTDPTNWDTDGDGFSDGYEISQGFDPLDPSSLPAGILGDINNDGVVDMADALLAQRHVSGLITLDSTQIARGDVAPVGAPDGILDIADVLVIMRKAMGLQ